MVSRKEVSVDCVCVREKRGGESQDRQTAAYNALIALIGQRHKIENSTPSQCGSVFQHVHAAGFWQAPGAISRVDRRVHDLLYFSYFASIFGQHAGMEIFLIRMEAILRASKESAPAHNSRFVPITLADKENVQGLLDKAARPDQGGWLSAAPPAEK